jgi:glycosyltransferase involved in cell wall biosynthesis
MGRFQPDAAAPNRRRPRILHIGPAPTVPDGGIAAYLLGLLASPLREGFDLGVLDVQVPEFFRRHRRWRGLLSIRFAAGLLWRLAWRRPQLVHVHTSEYGGFWEKSLLAALARRAGCPVLLHLHGGSFDHFLKSLEGIQAQRAAASLSRASRVIVLSENWRPLVAHFAPSERIEVLPNAIRWAEFAALERPAAGSSTRLLFLGMVSARKGLDELLQAVLELTHEPALEFTLEIVGHEEFTGDWSRYRECFAAAGLGNRVRFLGAAYGAEKLAALRRADLFVLPSRSESFGIANLEAMAAGLPVVSTRTGAIPEYIQDGVHGLLVEPGDARGLAAALRTLICDPAARLRMGAAARQASRAYDWEPLAARLGELYGRVLAEHGG